ncbi:hypothetical protein BJ085DRAFT_29274 [Dimargaris cristalligena]|uniref:Uncharacterized protein n=1 Tax=Dimargaris cristalligena TaxID=215637 RepID=A0A4P9ZQ41_9FUNG|nr:hypothetical protein BJ085DRAFT_29274 [Dimargaris cristalligena]|eukprot:RKP35584.1 hypothetical protein BJ085DRAFT_29274 [Dimargaris cristalligena]
MKFLVATPLVLTSLLAVACTGPYGSYSSSGSSIYDTESSDVSTKPHCQNSMDKSLRCNTSTSSLNEYERNNGLNEKTGESTFGGYGQTHKCPTWLFSMNLGAQGSSSHPYSPDSDTGYSSCSSH